MSLLLGLFFVTLPCLLPLSLPPPTFMYSSLLLRVLLQVLWFRCVVCSFIV